MKIATINTYGQTGLNPTKLLELEQFIEYHCLDLVCLQETNVSEHQIRNDITYKVFPLVPTRGKTLKVISFLI